MKPKITTILVLMLLPMIGQAQRQQYQQVNDILYTASSDAYAQERCKLDVYYPTDIQDAPVVVWFHGGGIEGGEKHIDPQLKKQRPRLALQVGAILVLSFLKLCYQVLCYETSMALVTFCFGSIFGMVTVRMPSSTLAEIWSFTTSSGSV